jgi:hypothetical protein
MNVIEAMKQALEALEAVQTDGLVLHGMFVNDTITSLRQAIAEAEKHVSYTGNGSAGRENMTAPTGFLFQMPKHEQAPVQEPHSWYSAQEDDWMTDKTRKEHERLNSYTHKVGGFDLALYTHPQPKREPLTDEEVNLFINGRGDEDDEDYVEPTGDGFGLTDEDLFKLVRRVEAAHGITGETK